MPMLSELPDLVLTNILSKLDVHQRLSAEESCRRLRNLSSDVPLPNEMAEKMRNFTRQALSDSPGERATQDRDKLLDLARYARTRPRFIQDAKSWSLTPPQVQKLRNSYYFRNSPDALRDAIENYDGVIKKLDLLDDHRGYDDWIHLLSPEDYSSAVMKGRDSRGNRFLAVKFSASIEYFGVTRVESTGPGILGLLQRDMDSKTCWTMSSDRLWMGNVWRPSRQLSDPFVNVPTPGDPSDPRLLLLSNLLRDGHTTHVLKMTPSSAGDTYNFYLA